MSAGPSNAPSGSPGPTAAAAVAVDVERLGYHYPDGSAALDEVSFRIAPGERVALVGPNGAGKSTLLLHLAGLLPERRRYLHAHHHDDRGHHHSVGGAVRIDGLELTPESLRAVRERIGVVFSDPDDQLIGLTVGEDVGFGPQARGWLPARRAAAVSEALAAVGLAGFEPRFPHHLSMGEKRRVCLAGVLACAPGLLLLDEPSAGLDPRGRRELGALLAAQRATQVVASHDLPFLAGFCSRALLVDHGRLVADRAFPDLIADEPLLAAHGLA